MLFPHKVRGQGFQRGRQFLLGWLVELMLH
jgi:hypothetical protein